MISRRHALAAAATLLCVPTARSQPTIGLAERRAIAAYRQDRYPALEKAIQDAAGFPVPVEVAWDQLTVAGDAQYYADDTYFGTTIFGPLAAGLKVVGKDGMGRDALRQSLKGIRVRYDERTAVASNFARGLTFTDGVLDVNWRPFANTSDVQPRIDAVVQVLEKNL